MKSKIIRIADLNQFEVNPEYKNVSVTEEEIQAQIESLALQNGNTVSTAALEENCCVVCRSDDGDKVLLYPSLQIAGLEQAVNDVKCMKASDTFTTEIKGKTITLTVEGFLANRPLAIDDSLPEACGLDASTLEELKMHLIEENIATKANKNIRSLVMEYEEYINNNSEVEIDESEAREWAVDQAQKVYEEELSYGIDLRFTEDGEMLTEEEALERLADDLCTQFVASLIQEQFAKEVGYVPSSNEEEGVSSDQFVYEYLTARAKEALS